MNTFIKASVSLFLVILIFTLLGIGYIGYSLSQLKIDHEIQKELSTKIEYMNGFMNSMIVKADSLQILFDKMLQEIGKVEYGKPTRKKD